MNMRQDQDYNLTKDGNCTNFSLLLTQSSANPTNISNGMPNLH